MTMISRRLMRAAVAACLTGLAGSALAQGQPQPASPGSVQIAPVKPRMRPAPVPRSVAPGPGGQVLGVPVTADAPVSPPYDGTAYKTLGGQSETGADAIAGQVMQPTGAGPAPR